MSAASADMAFRARENRLRRMAQRQGLRLTKIDRRDPLARDHGHYRLFDGDTGTELLGGRWGVDFGEVERYLTFGKARP
ncbi:MAG: hypothetical protein ACREN1_07620 [Candidatus Dormibacteria bacterium]